MNLLQKYIFRRDLLKAVNRKRRLIYRRLTKNTYRDQKALFEQAGVDPKLIVDIGACVGEITNTYLLLFPHANIYAVEPSPSTYEQLRKRFATASRIFPCEIAISDQVGTSQFFVSNVANTNSLMPTVSTKRQSIEVATSTLEDFAKTYHIDHINILKVDTEGAEAKVFNGSTKLLQEARIDVISTEVRFETVYEGETLFPDLVVLLKQYGYVLHNLYVNRENKYMQAEYADATFLSPPFRKSLKSTK